MPTKIDITSRDIKLSQNMHKQLQVLVQQFIEEPDLDYMFRFLVSALALWDKRITHLEAHLGTHYVAPEDKVDE